MNNEIEPIVISAFMHTGKAQLAHKWSDACIYISGEDMDEDEFVAEVKKHLEKKLYPYILVPSSQKVRDALTLNDIHYIIIGPFTSKDEYIRRALAEPDRSFEHILWLYQNWDRLLDELIDDGSPIIWLNYGETIGDVLFGK